MIKLKQIVLFTAIVIGITTSTVNAQLKTPAPSPTQTLEQDFGLSTVKVNYSRPGAKGRVVYGNLVPFGKVWRTGANSSTKVTFGDDVKIEEKDLKAGTYALYTIPNKESWDVMFYSDLTLGGNVSDYKAEKEVLKVTVKPTAICNKVETFTINMVDITNTSANFIIVWEQTRVVLKVTTDVDATIMKNIESSVLKDNRPYFAAARYYYENDKDQNLALEWVTKALEASPKAYWIAHQKAKIQLKLKDYKGAVATAEQSKALAQADQADEYVKMNDELIAEAKKGK